MNIKIIINFSSLSLLFFKTLHFQVFTTIGLCFIFKKLFCDNIQKIFCYTSSVFSLLLTFKLCQLVIKSKVIYKKYLIENLR